MTFDLRDTMYNDIIPVTEPSAYHRTISCFLCVIVVL